MASLRLCPERETTVPESLKLDAAVPHISKMKATTLRSGIQQKGHATIYFKTWDDQAAHYKRPT